MIPRNMYESGYLPLFRAMGQESRPRNRRQRPAETVSQKNKKAHSGDEREPKAAVLYTTLLPSLPQNITIPGQLQSAPKHTLDA